MWTNSEEGFFFLILLLYILYIVLVISFMQGESEFEGLLPIKFIFGKKNYFNKYFCHITEVGISCLFFFNFVLFLIVETLLG